MFSKPAMLAALCVSVTVSYGILWYGYSVLQIPMQRELGWSTALLNGGAALAMLVSGVLAAPFGRWFDRRGTQLPMSLGSIVATLGLILWASATLLPVYFLAWLLIGIGRALVVYEAAFHAVNQQYETPRHALTLLTFAGGFASVIFIPLINFLLGSFSWREVILILAAVEAITLWLHWRFMPNSPQQKNVSKQIMPPHLPKNPVFVRLTQAFALLAASGVTLNLQAIPILLEKGYSLGFASGIGALVGLMGLPGRLVFTPLGAKIGGFQVLALLGTCQALGALALVLPVSWSAHAYLLLYGIGFGAIAPNKAALLAECFGTAHYGQLSGLMTTRNLLFHAGAPVLVGVMQGWFGSYQPVLGFLGLCSLVAVYLLLTCAKLPRPAHIQGVSL
jgi:MFS family permease